MPDDPAPSPEPLEVRIERVLANPTIAPAYVNAVFSSRIGDDLVLDFGHFDPADFHEARQSGGKQAIGAWVVFRALLTKTSIHRLKRLLEDFEQETSSSAKPEDSNAHDLPPETDV